jgi:hypothetical protein
MADVITKRTKHVLAEPVTFEGSTHTEINLRRLKGKDIRDMENIEGATEKSFFIIGRLAGWPPEAIDEMDGADIEACGKIIEGFMGRRKRG